MGAPLDPALAEEMRRRANEIRERQSSGTYTRQWNLTGKKSIVEPGRAITARFLPRWDYGQSMIRQGEKLAPNPAYKPGRAFVKAFEHWWDGDGGRRAHAWCLHCLTPDEKKWFCPVCSLSQAMQESDGKEDQKYGKAIAASEIYIFNAVIGYPRALDEQKLADIRIMSVFRGIARQIFEIMTGGENEKFARGDITHPRLGYDLLLTRPTAQGQAWTVTPAPDPSPLYAQDQAAAFKGWVTRLIDLEGMIKKETLTPEGLFKKFYGRDPEAGELERAVGVVVAEPEGEETETVADEFVTSTPSPATPPTAAVSAPPVEPDDEFMPPPATAPAAAPRAPAAPVGPKRPARR